MRGVLLGLAAAALCGVASAQVVTRPDWARRPTGEEMMRYFPDEAIDRSVSGRVTVLCVANIEGRLEDCRVVSESPAGMGFGNAVIRAAEKEFRMNPGTVDGKPVGGVQVRFSMVILAPTASARYVITEAVWAEAPTFEDMAAAWPAEVGDLAVGTAVLRCQVAPRSGGRLRNCTIAGQTPKGAPFGAAARTLAGKFRLKLTPDEEKKYASADIAISFRFYNPATPAGQAKKVEKPDWIVRIDPERAVALFPKKAMEAGVEAGTGVADCLVASDGKLTDCRVGSETPAGLDFGPAAVVAAGVMQMDPWTPDGRPVAGARVRLPIQFVLEPKAEPEAPQ